MANTTRKKRRRSPFVRTILRLFFILLLFQQIPNFSQQGNVWSNLFRFFFLFFFYSRFLFLFCCLKWI